jgi:predicted 2-oxoglutarate/Fe(II)-dependent dioxygenase YbiX
MTHLFVGEPAPWFDTSTPSRASFAFSSVAGRYVLLGFLPQDASRRSWALAALEAEQGLFDDYHLASFIVIRDASIFASLKDRGGRRWFFDPDGEISRLYGALDDEGQEQPIWVLIDPSMRILHIAAIEGTAGLVQRLRGLPKVDDHAGAPLHAPVLIVPRIFEPEICRRLVCHYEADGGAPSGVMREVNGKTVPVLDDFKSRRDANVTDEAFQRELRVRISRRLVPEIKKAFQFTATRIERYIVARYDASEGGYFRPHRDNTTAGTAHRRFAVSINLNAEEYEGGDLRFPEFGSRTYRPPTGGAVVFSCSLLHEATPVTRGRRYAFLPFLFDDAAEAIRQTNRHVLQVAPEPPSIECKSGAREGVTADS